ncbi:hypothetical protein G9A89_008102 [Geosiphon pyriformis]|nr:hypothetical protein G9A89_008102 [Geosiphon pyriformis]
MFILSNLIGVVVDHNVAAVNDYFDTDHKAVSVSIKNMAANAAMFCDEFGAAGRSSDLDSIWNALRQVVCLSAESVFKKKWFKSYDSIFNRASSRFHKLELLVLRIVKASRLASLDNGLDSINASVVRSFFLSGFYFDAIRSVLAKIRKSYPSSKLSELDCARKSQIRSVIDRRMESFELNKGHTIRSVLKHLFRKVVLDHLVVGDELILEPDLVKSKVDMIMEN